MRLLIHNRDTDTRNGRSICQVTLGGTYLITGATIVLLCAGWGTRPISHTVILLGICGAALLYAVITHILVSIQQYRVASYLLLGFYMSLATGIVGAWGINTPIGPLLYGVVVVLAGILLTARHALYTAGIVGLLLITFQICFLQGWYTPNTTWNHANSTFGDVFSYWIVFGMLALVSWLYNREMENSLTQARRAEQALRRQKATLELQVQRRTKQLRESQLEELQQMYRVTELGQMGISLLHDLANNLTALQLEIEGLESGRRARSVTHARQITRYLGDIVDSTLARIHGTPPKRNFNIIQKTNETVAFLRHKAAESKVEIDWQPPAKNWQFTADPVSFGQVLTLLAGNAIEAYKNSPPGAHRQVALTMRRTDKHIIITIGSQSKIPKHVRHNLFKPFYTSKKTGMGLGLYIAKQTIRGQMDGTLTLHTANHYTEFVITLPRQDVRAQKTLP